MTRRAQGSIARLDLRRATAAFVAALLTTLVVAWVGGPRVEAALPDQQFAVMSGWNVGAQPRICENDGLGGWTNCQNVPITDGKKDSTAGIDQGDFNNDGLVDIAIANQGGSLNSCIQTTPGAWSCQSNGSTDRHSGMVVRDFNGDGNDDLVSSIETLSTMEICLGDGTGGFTCARVAAPYGGTQLDAADIDGDGDLDLAYPAVPGPGGFCVNDGNANFTCTGLPELGNTFGADTADLNGDGNADAVFSSWGGDDHLCLGDGAGGFTCSVFHVGGDNTGIEVADIDNDGDPDVVMGTNNGPVRSCLNNGLGALTCSNATVESPLVRSLDVRDTNGDGIVDLLLGSYNQNLSCVGDGLGGFTCATIDSVSWHTLGALIVGTPPPPPDTDGDGITDPGDNCVDDPNPAQVDTDADGLGDVCDPDDDGDTLTDADETTTYLTDPLLADTDGDTLDDGAEITIHLTDPLDPDTDGDTLDDGAEITIHSTNPLDPDTDGDTFDDGFEVLNGSDPTLPPVPQAIAILTPPDRTLDQGPFTVAPTTSSGLDVNVAASGVCDAVGDTVTPTGAGTCTLTLTQAGDSAWLPAPPVVLSLTIDPGVQIITIAPTGPVAFGDGPSTVVATASSGLPVTLSTTGPCMTTGMVLTVTGTGTCTLFADQGGDTDWQPAITASADVTIGLGNQVIDFVPPSDLAFGDPAIELTAVATSVLPVDFAATGSCTVTAGMLVTTGAGDCTVTADQPGNGNWAPAPTTTATVVVGPAEQTITVAPVTDRRLDEDPVDIDASSTSGLPVDLAVSGSCILDGTTVTPTGSGPCAITADQEGNSDWATAPSTTMTFDVLPGQQTIEVTAPIGRVYRDEPVELEPTASSGLPVSAIVEGPCRIEGLVLTIDGAGNCAVTFTQDGNEDWEAAPDQRLDVVIGQASQQVDLTTLGDVRYGDAPRTVAATATSGLPVEIRAAGECALNDDQLRTTGAGTCTVTASQQGDENWAAAAPATASFTISKAPATILVEGTTVGPSDEPQLVEVATEPAGLSGTEVRYDGSLVPPTDPGVYRLEVTLDHPDFEAEPVVTDFTVLEPAVEVDDEYRLISMAFDQVLADGLPTPAADGTLLTITGLTPGTVVSISSGGTTIDVVADDTGVVTFDLAPPFDLAEATLNVEFPDGTNAVVSTEEALRVGDSELLLTFEATEGTDIGATTVAVTGAGLRPDSTVDVYVHSTPILIGTVTTDINGSFDQVLALPAELEIGEHRILLQGQGPTGPLVGTWFFAVDDSGAIERLGDPETALEAVTQTTNGPVPPSLALVESPNDEAATTGDVEIDEATGLPVYDAIEDPEQSVDSGVNGFALLTVVAAAGGSMAALSSMATSSTGGLGTSGTGGGGESSRGRGRVASGEAASLGDDTRGLAWGDASPSWRWPWVAQVDNWSRETPDRIRPISPLLSRILADGSTMRATFGSGALVGPVLGVLLGLVAVADTGGQAIAPSVVLVAALIVLGVFDSASGLVGAATFAIGVIAAGGVDSGDAVRTLMGIGSLWFAVPLIAGGSRQFRREIAISRDDRIRRVADVLIGSLLGAWAVQTVVRSLPGLAGLDLPIAGQAERIALITLAALIGRYVLETVAVRVYPARLAMVQPINERVPGEPQQLASMALRTGVFVFVILPYTGAVWQLWIVVALSMTPQLLGLVQARLPNIPSLFRLLPKGVPNILVMLAIGKLLAGVLADRIADPVDLTLTSFVVLSIPGFILGLGGLFGRDGDELPTDLLGRAAGAVVVIVTVLTVRGVFDESLAWAAVVVAPALAWWTITAWRNDQQRSDDRLDAEDDSDSPPAARSLQPA